MSTSNEPQTPLQESAPKGIQAAIDEIVWFNGPEPLQWPSTVFLGLAARGILVKHLTHHRLSLARDRCLEETKRRLRDSKFGLPLQTEFTGPDESVKEDIVKKLIKLRESRKQLPDNMVSEVNTPDSILNTKEIRVSVTALQVKESEVRETLIALGIESARDPKKWSVKKMNQKLADADSFGDLLSSAKKGSILEGANKDLLQNISDTLAEGGEVVVVGEKSHETSGHATEENDMSATLTAPKKKKASSKKKDEGSRKLSLLGAAWLVMSNKPRKKYWKVPEIMEEISNQKLWKSKEGKTPEATLSSSMYMEIVKKKEQSRFAKGEEGFSLT